MKKNTQVSWLIAGQKERGSGVTIADEVDGHILVAVDTFAGEEFPGFHSVIWCTVTWLTPVAAETAAPGHTVADNGEVVQPGPIVETGVADRNAATDAAAVIPKIEQPTLPALLVADEQDSVSIYCPGCKCGHRFPTKGSEPIWSFNGNLEKPTFKPSMKITGGGCCHSQVTDGNIFFYSDTTHELAGKTVPLLPFGELATDPNVENGATAGGSVKSDVAGSTKPEMPRINGDASKGWRE